MTTTSGALNSCIFYFVHVQPDTGAPIPSTMFSRSTQYAVATCAHLIAPVPNTQQVVPAGNQACVNNHTHLRYYYRVDNRTRAVIPNSMFTHVGSLKTHCSGTNQILEFIPTRPN